MWVKKKNLKKFKFFGFVPTLSFLIGSILEMFVCVDNCSSSGGKILVTGVSGHTYLFHKTHELCGKTYRRIPLRKCVVTKVYIEIKKPLDWSS